MSNQSGKVALKYTFSCLLEFAANNDVDGFTRSCTHFHAVGGETGLWYTYQKVLRRMVTEHMTPLLIAARYGSVDIMRIIISQPGVNVNQVSEPERSTALHCAASGGSANAVDIIKLLLFSGANVNAMDARGNRPCDVIVTRPNCPDLKLTLQGLLNSSDFVDQPSKLPSTTNSELNSPFPSRLCQINSNPCKEHIPSGSEKGQRKLGPSLLDIKDHMYLTDEFRMYSFKIEPCEKFYSHDWTQCPFAHPGEHARRRDPRKFHYSCIPCPDFKKGTCRRGDLCTYAHGLFECWLHPTQYRTRLCKDGCNCTRRVCFFAHTSKELRAVHLSAESEVAYPRVANWIEVRHMDAGLNHLPGSPSAFTVMLPNPSSPPISPIENLIPVLAHQSFSSMHINSNFLRQDSLRCSLNARGTIGEELDKLQKSERQQHYFLSDISGLLLQHMNFPLQSATNFEYEPPNADEIFSTESLFSHCFDQPAVSSFSPSQKRLLLDQFQQHSSMSSPIEKRTLFPKNLNHPSRQALFGVSPLQAMSSCATTPLSPLGSYIPNCDHCKKPYHHLSSIWSQEIKSRQTQAINLNGSIQSPVNTRAVKSVPDAAIDWSSQAEKLDRL